MITVQAFVLAVALCPQCEMKPVTKNLMTGEMCHALMVEYQEAFPGKLYSCGEVVGRTIEVSYGDERSTAL